MRLRPVCRSLRAMRARGLVSLTALAWALASSPVRAETLIIDEATEDPVATATADGGLPANIRVENTGSITLTNGVAVTINSDNRVLMSGTVTLEDRNGTIGFSIDPGFTGRLAIDGRVLLEGDVPDTDLEHPDFANNKRGVILNAGGTFTGDIRITKSGNLGVRGDNSKAIDLQGHLTGDVLIFGVIALRGDNSVALDVAGGIDGDVHLARTIGVTGIDSWGVRTTSVISGGLQNEGAIVITGYDDTTLDPPDEDDDGVDEEDNDVQAGYQSNAAIGIGASIGEGFLNNGPTEQQIIDLENGDIENDELNPSGTITVSGSANAVLISPVIAGASAGDITLGSVGADDEDFGFVNRGAITVNGIYEGVASEAIRIEGANVSGTDYTTTIENGVRNERSVVASANQADSVALAIGNLASVPLISNTSGISASVSGTRRTEAKATAVSLEAGANVQALENSGAIESRYFGKRGDATAIRDLSGTLTFVHNTGSLQARLIAVDDGDDDTNDTPVGEAFALDLSATSNDITYLQELPDDFDPDTGNENESVILRGNVLMGSGSDRFNIYAGQVLADVHLGAGDDFVDLSSGEVSGDLYFDAGADRLRIRGGAQFVGSISDSDGQLSLDVLNGTLGFTEPGPVEITDAFFGERGVLGVSIDVGRNKASRLVASGNVTFSDGAHILPRFTEVLTDDLTKTIVVADSIDIQGELTDLLGARLPFVYRMSLELDEGTTDRLVLTLSRKNARQLHIPENRASVFRPLMRAMRDDALAAGLLLATTKKQFDAAYLQFVPNYTDAMITMSRQSVSDHTHQIRRRLEELLVAKRGGGAWVDESVYSLNRSGDNIARGYDAQGAVLSLGLDDALNDSVMLGLIFGLDNGSYEEDGDFDDTVAIRRWTGGGYAGGRMGDFMLTGSALYALTKHNTERRALFDNVGRAAESEWTGNRYAGDITLTYLGDVGRIYFRPAAGVNYLHVYDDAYTETGGADPDGTGDAFDLEVDSRSGDSLNTYAEIAIGLNPRAQPGDRRAYVVAPEIRAGWTYDLIDDPISTRARFVSGREWFTLTSDDRDTQLFTGGASLNFFTPLGSFGLDINGNFGDNSTSYGGRLHASFRF